MIGSSHFNFVVLVACGLMLLDGDAIARDGLAGTPGVVLPETVSPDLEARTPEAEHVQVLVGETLFLALPGARRVVVGDGQVIGVKPMKGGGVLLAGKKEGQTSLLVWSDASQPRRVVVSVSSSEAVRLEADVKRALGGDQGLSVHSVGGQLLVTGVPSTPEQGEKIRSLSERHPKLVNLTKSDGTEKMIAMEVRFLEIKKNAMENLGVQWQKSMAGPMVGIVGDFKTNPRFRPTSDGSLVNGSPNISPNFPGLDSAQVGERVAPFATYMGLQATLLSVIQFMEQEGDAVVLAEPMLSTRSGGTAKFLAGGEIPLPVTSSLGQGSVQFKPYGIRFEIQPRVTEKGVISANVLTELSTVDPALKVGDLPGFLSRMTETQVNLREGETLVLSGLLSEEGSKSLEKVSGLGDIPILGALFRSKDFRQRRSEMVVMVTPRLISPEDAFHRRIIERSSENRRQVEKRIFGREAKEQAQEGGVSND